MADQARATVKLFLDGVQEPVAVYNFVKESSVEDDGEGCLDFDTSDNRSVSTTLKYIAEFPSDNT